MNEIKVFPIGKIENENGEFKVTVDSIYKNGLKGPKEIGVFALRSPERPNPIAVSNVSIAYVDEKVGIIGLYYIDAFPGSMVLDLKPYTPSIDRIENPITPKWCSHWPKSYEESSVFNWEDEFNF